MACTARSYSFALLVGAWCACGASGHPSAQTAAKGAASSGSANASSSASLAPRTPCERAADFVARVPPLLDEGKLRRAQRVLARADALCPDVHAGHADVDALILAELGRIQDAADAIAGIDMAHDNAPYVTPLLAKAKEIVATAKVADAAAKANHDAVDKALAAADQDRDTFEASPDNATPLAAKALADKYEAVWNLAHADPGALYWAGHFAKAVGEVARAQVLFDKAIVELERVNQQKMVLYTPNGFEAPDYASYSPDGRHVLTIKDMRNERFRLLAVPSYQIERTFDFSPGAMAWSHDSRLLAIDNATINVVDVATGRVVNGMALSHDTTTSIAFSPDDQRIAWAIEGRAIAIGRIGSYDQKVLVPHTTPMHSPVLFAPDGASVGAVIAHAGHLDVQWWDAITGKPSRSQHVGALADHVWVLELSPDQTKLLVSYFDPSHPDRSPANTSLQLWDVPTGKLLRTLRAHHDPPVRALWSTDGDRIVSVDDGGARERGRADIGPAPVTAYVWDPTSNNWLTKMEAKSLQPLAFVPHRHAVLAKVNGKTELLPGVPGKANEPVALFSGDLSHAVIAACSPDASMFATSDGDQMVTTWDLRATPTTLTAKDWPGHPVHRLAWSPNSHALAIGFSDGAIAIDDNGKGVVLPAYEGNRAAVDALAWSPDGHALAAANNLNTVHMWDVRSLQLLPLALSNPSPITAITFTPDGLGLAVGAADGVVRFWQLSTASIASELHGNPSPVVSLTYRPDGHWLIAGFQSHAPVGWETTKGTRVHAFGDRAITLDSVDYAPNGNWFATVKGHREIELWDTKSQIQYDSVRFYVPDTLGLGITHDSAFLVVSEPASTHVFNVFTGQESASLRSLPVMAAGYVWTPEGDVDFVGQDAAKAKAFVECSFGQVQYPFELCEESFVVPGLLTKVLAGQELEP